jgi:hypothetical protein
VIAAGLWITVRPAQVLNDSFRTSEDLNESFKTLGPTANPHWAPPGVPTGPHARAAGRGFAAVMRTHGQQLRLLRTPARGILATVPHYAPHLAPRG